MNFHLQSRMRCLSILLAGAGLIGPVQAQDLPTRRAGLWEVRITPDDGKVPPQVMQQCTDAETDRLMVTFGSDVAAGMCSRHDVRRAGRTFVLTATCKVGPVTVVTHSVVSGDFNSNYTVKVTSKAEGVPAFARGLVPGNTTIDARWVGVCNAKQRPGDIVMADGRTINIRDFKKMLGGDRTTGPSGR